jgi:hypothetical protein
VCCLSDGTLDLLLAGLGALALVLDSDSTAAFLFGGTALGGNEAAGRQGQPSVRLLALFDCGADSGSLTGLLGKTERVPR